MALANFTCLALLLALLLAFHKALQSISPVLLPPFLSRFFEGKRSRHAVFKREIDFLRITLLTLEGQGRLVIRVFAGAKMKAPPWNFGEGQKLLLWRFYVWQTAKSPQMRAFFKNLDA